MLSVRRCNRTEQSPSCKANISSAFEKIPRILWSRGFHYRVHQGHPLASSVSQINPIHNLEYYSFKLHFNIVLPSIRSNFFLLGLCTKTLYSFFFLSLCLLHAPFPHLVLLDLISKLHYFTPKRYWLLNVYTDKSFTSQNNQYFDMKNEPGNDFLH